VDKQLLNWKGKVSKKTSGKRADVPLLHMTISEMRGKNLEEMDSAMFGGGSDPYVVVSTDPATNLLYKGVLLHGHEGIKSSVISETPIAQPYYPINLCAGMIYQCQIPYRSAMVRTCVASRA
jgi:hypothetical protein